MSETLFQNLSKGVTYVVSAFSFLFTRWWSLIVAPIYKPEMLWIIVPIYLNWLISEYFQEKEGTGLGNAVSNGFTLLWVALDWTREVYITHVGKRLAWIPIFTKVGLSALAGIYGLIIMIYSIKGEEIAHAIGRKREVTYVLLCITPIIYDAVLLDTYLILSMFVFFPIFYFAVGILMKILPNPETLD